MENVVGGGVETVVGGGVETVVGGGVETVFGKTVVFGKSWKTSSDFTVGVVCVVYISFGRTFVVG